jgi:hypothetical protein
VGRALGSLIGWWCLASLPLGQPGDLGGRAVQDHSMVLARLPRAYRATRVEARPAIEIWDPRQPPVSFGGPTPLQKARLLRSLARRFSGNFESRSLRNCRREMPRSGSFVRYPWLPKLPSAPQEAHGATEIARLLKIGRASVYRVPRNPAVSSALYCYHRKSRF